MTNQNAVSLLQLIGENLRSTDRATYRAVEVAIGQGARPQVQITFGSDPTIALGFIDDYDRTRWVHTMPLQ